MWEFDFWLRHWNTVDGEPQKLKRDVRAELEAHYRGSNTESAYERRPTLSPRG